ncbi:MAG: peptidylprolyl isomerase [Ilumatobacteraceae bacterium]
MGTAKRDRQRANRQQRLEELAREAKKDKSRKWGLRIGIIVILAVGLMFLVAQLSGDDDKSDTVASVPTTVVETTTTLDPNATTTIAGETTTTVEESTTTVALEPFTYGKGGCPAMDGTSIKQSTFTQAFKQCIDPSKTYTATFDTSEGKIVVALDTANVPGTVNNFVSLANFHYYDGSLIFRADPSIDIIQGGGKTNSDTPGYTIPDEKNGFTYSEGDLVMARTSSPDSAGAQWFFVGGPNASNLDAQGTYVTFGHVTEGLDVVKAILALAGGDDGQTPTRTVTVTSITIQES